MAPVIWNNRRLLGADAGVEPTPRRIWASWLNRLSYLPCITFNTNIISYMTRFVNMIWKNPHKKNGPVANTQSAPDHPCSTHEKKKERKKWEYVYKTWPSRRQTHNQFHTCWKYNFVFHYKYLINGRICQQFFYDKYENSARTNRTEFTRKKEVESTTSWYPLIPSWLLDYILP